MVLQTYSTGCSFTPPMVEATGVEPVSEILFTKLSPGAGDGLNSLTERSAPTYPLGSFIDA